MKRGGAARSGLHFEALVAEFAPLFLGESRTQERFDQVLESNIKVGVGLRACYTRFQAAHHLQPNVLVQDALRRSGEQVAPGIDGILHGDRDPNVRSLTNSFAEKSRRAHANDFKGRTPNLNGSAKRGGVEAEALLPECVTDHG